MTKKSLSITPLNYFYWSIKCSISRGKYFNRRPFCPCPIPIPAPLSPCPSPSRFVCRTHVNDVLIVACPLWVTFGFRLWSVWHIACPPVTVCGSLQILHNIRAFLCKRCQFVDPPCPLNKARPWRADNFVKWRRFSFTLSNSIWKILQLRFP